MTKVGSAPLIVLAGAVALAGMLGACSPAFHTDAIDTECGPWPLQYRSATITMATARKLSGGDLLDLDEYARLRARCVTGLADKEAAAAEQANWFEAQWKNMRAAAFREEGGEAEELARQVEALVNSRGGRPPETDEATETITDTPD